MFKTAFSQKNVNNLDTLRQISTVTIDFKLADIKLGSSEAFLLKLEKNLSSGLEVNVVLNICRYFKRGH